MGCDKRGFSFSAGFPGLLSFSFTHPIVQKFHDTDYATEGWAGQVNHQSLCWSALTHSFGIVPNSEGAACSGALHRPPASWYWWKRDLTASAHCFSEPANYDDCFQSSYSLSRQIRLKHVTQSNPWVDGTSEEIELPRTWVLIKADGRDRNQWELMEGSGKAFQVDGTSAHVWSVVRIEEERALRVKETKREEQRLRISSAHWEEGQTSLTHFSGSRWGGNGWWQAGSWIVYCSRNQFMEVGKREPWGLEVYNSDT